MIGKKLFEVLKDFKLDKIESASESIKILSESDIEQIAKSMDNSSITIEEARKLFNSTEFNVLTNKYMQLSLEPDLTRYIQRMLLYVDKIAVYNQFGFISSGLPKGFNLEFVKDQFIKNHLPVLLNFKPLIENDILYLVKPTDFFNKYNELIQSSSMEDVNNHDYKSILTKETKIGTFVSNSNAIDFTIGSRKALLVPPMRIGRSGVSTFSFKIGEPVNSKPLSYVDDKPQAKKLLSNVYLGIAKDINSDILLSNVLNTHYVTDNNLDWELLHTKLSNITNKNLKLIPAIINLDLKFLEGIPYEDIIKIRTGVENEFKDFRSALSTAFGNISDLPNTPEFKNKVNKIEAEIISPQLRKLDREFATTNRFHLTRMPLISVTSLITTCLSGNILPAIAGSADIIKEGIDWEKELSNLKNNSMYFLWKLKN